MIMNMRTSKQTTENAKRARRSPLSYYPCDGSIFPVFFGPLPYIRKLVILNN